MLPSPEHAHGEPQPIQTTGSHSIDALITGMLANPEFKKTVLTMPTDGLTTEKLAIQIQAAFEKNNKTIPNMPQLEELPKFTEKELLQINRAITFSQQIRTGLGLDVDISEKIDTLHHFIVELAAPQYPWLDPEQIRKEE